MTKWEVVAYQGNLPYDKFGGNRHFGSRDKRLISEDFVIKGSYVFMGERPSF